MPSLSVESGDTVVSSLSAQGLARGHLVPGDQPVLINDIPLAGLAHADVLRLCATGLSLSMVVKRRIGADGMPEDIVLDRPEHTPHSLPTSLSSSLSSSSTQPSQSSQPTQPAARSENGKSINEVSSRRKVLVHQESVGKVDADPGYVMTCATLLRPSTTVSFGFSVGTTGEIRFASKVCFVEFLPSFVFRLILLNYHRSFRFEFPTLSPLL